MRLELDEISAGGIVREYSIPAESFPELKELVDSGQMAFVTPVAFSLRLQRPGQMVELDGTLAVTIQEVCGRCLADLETRITSTFSLTFTPRKEEESGGEEEVELEAEELGLIAYEGDAIDLSESLQEQVIISLPISPLCKEDCRGLCAECGTNLNETSCACEKKVFNNKFAALRKLKIEP
ncbi:MAG: DUF177 domain-containing protein [Desulfuromonadales bacterium]|nr:DUF177 domain-containing protein [Desulfuromonadales bacterium]